MKMRSRLRSLSSTCVEQRLEFSGFSPPVAKVRLTLLTGALKKQGREKRGVADNIKQAAGYG
jgi:hypothetical protein